MAKIDDILNPISKVGSTVTPFVGLGLGIGQSVKAGRLRREADNLIPAAEDPEQRNLLNLVRRKARAIETGTDPVTAAGRKIISRNLSTTQGNLVRSSAGDPRTLIEGLRRTSRNAADATTRLAATTYPASQYYTQLGANLLNKISSRKFDLTMSQRAQKLREASELKNASNRNIAGFLGTSLPA